MTLDFPARPATICGTPSDLRDGLGVSPIITAKARDYVAVFETEQAVRNLRPDMSVLMRLDCLGINFARVARDGASIYSSEGSQG